MFGSVQVTDELLKSCATMEDRLIAMATIMIRHTGGRYKPSDIKKAAFAFYKLLCIGDSYRPSTAISCNVHLIRASDRNIESESLGHDYSLSKVNYFSLCPRIGAEGLLVRTFTTGSCLAVISVAQW